MFNLELSTHELDLINKLVVEQKRIETNDDPIKLYILDSVLEKIGKASFAINPSNTKDKLQRATKLIYSTANEIVSILIREVNFENDNEEMESLYFDFMRGVMKLNRITRNLDD